VKISSKVRKMNPVELKVKSKALEAEAKIIRTEENRVKAQFRYNRYKQEQRKADAASFRLKSLQDHRRGIVRQVAHDTFIARAFLGGRPYSTHAVTKKGMGYTSWYSVRNMVRKYGGPEFKIMTNEEIDDKLEAWKILTSNHLHS
jgi:hypothetical protein